MNSLKTKFYDKVRYKKWHSVSNQVFYRIWNQIYDKSYDKVWDQVSKQIKIAVDKWNLI